MKLRGLLVGAALCAATAMWSSAVYSQAKDEKKPEAAKPAPTAPAAKPADKPATPPAAKPGDKPAAPAGGEMDSMMKAMSEMSGPGKEHDALKPMVGSFTCANKMNFPGMPPMESTGSVDRKWLMGGRYLEEVVKGNMMGMNFEGLSITGYDKMQKQYHSYWIDNMGTGWWFMTGTADAAGKVFTFSGENFDPMAGVKKNNRSTVDLTDPNKHVFKMYDKGPDGKEFVNFEMTCTRK